MEVTLSPIWVSSVEHLEKFTKITRPRWKFLFRLKKIPVGFPKIQSSLGAFPTVFFSQGTLSLFPGVLEYRSDFHPVMTNATISNLQTDLMFEVDYTSLKISRFNDPSPFLSAFNLPWIRLIFSIKDQQYDLLVSVGGEGMTKVKATVQNQQLFEMFKSRGAIVN
jgi:hypothetical protein